MFSKLFIQFLCLSVALIQIEAMIRHSDNENEITNEKREPEPNPESERRHHGGGHHHKRHHKHHHHHHKNMVEGEMSPPSQGQLPDQPKHHEVLTRLWPLFKVLLNRNYHKDGKIELTDDSKMESASKARALVMSKINSKYTEVLLTKNENTNESLLLTKTLEQNGETDAIIDFNSDMGVVSDKILRAKSEEESKPVEEKAIPENKMRAYHKRESVNPAHHLRRMKRADEEPKKDGDNFWSSLKKAGDKIKEGWKKHVEEPAKKFAEKIKTKVEELKKKRQDAKAGEQGGSATEASA